MTDTLIAFVGMAIAVLLFLAFIVLWGKWVTRNQPKSEAPEEEHPPRQSTPTPTIGDRIMSRVMGSAGPIEAVADRLPVAPQEAGQGMAKPGNAVNEVLPGNVLPEEVRETIRFWAMVEVAERMIGSGKHGQTEAIEIAFGCKRSGRPESVYARARAALQAREQPRYLHPLTPEQQRTREELALE